MEKLVFVQRENSQYILLEIKFVIFLVYDCLEGKGTQKVVKHTYTHTYIFKLSLTHTYI